MRGYACDAMEAQTILLMGDSATELDGHPVPPKPTGWVVDRMDINKFQCQVRKKGDVSVCLCVPALHCMMVGLSILPSAHDTPQPYPTTTLTLPRNDQPPWHGQITCTGPTSGRLCLSATLDPKSSLPEALVNFATKQLVGVLIYLLQVIGGVMGGADGGGVCTTERHVNTERERHTQTRGCAARYAHRQS